MKNLILAIILQAICFHAKSQTIDLPSLFKKIDSATQQITTGQFKLNESYVKVSVGEDSSRRFNSYDFYFKSNPLDTLIGYKILSLSNSGLQQLYNGNELLVLTSWNRKLEIAPAANNGRKIKQIKQSISAFPLFKSINSVFLHATKYQKEGTWNLAPDKVNYKGQSCYKISTPPNIGKNNKDFAIYYVSIDSFVPVGQEIIIENDIASAKEIQTFEAWISDFKPNKNISDQQFNKEALSRYDMETIVDEMKHTENNDLLKNGSLSPDWELPLINGGKLKMSNLRDKIVILDFWYKACAPCQKQMIDLQQLHDKFDKNKVVFIGVNTLDDPVNDKLGLFLKNRGLTMKSVYKGRDIQKLYNVYASPALFIIDGKGKIVFSKAGYSDTIIEDVSNEIEKIL